MICPFCAEEIKDEAIKCKHCGEFLDGRNTSLTSSVKTGIGQTTAYLKDRVSDIFIVPKECAMPRENCPVNILGCDFHTSFFTHKSKRHNYSDIYRLWYSSSVQYTNGIGGGSACLYVFVKNVTDPIVLKKGRAFAFIEKGLFPVMHAYAILKPITKPYRLNYYMEELKTKGFVQYDENSKIHIDGRFQYKTNFFDIGLARKNGMLQVGTVKFNTWRYNHYINPFRLSISNEGFGMFDKKAEIDCYYDIDILPDIFSMIAGL